MKMVSKRNHYYELLNSNFYNDWTQKSDTNISPMNSAACKG